MIFYTSWRPVLLAIGTFTMLFVYGYHAQGLTTYYEIGVAGAVAYTLWLVGERYTAYIKIDDRRWLTNAGQKSFSNDHVDISAILYIARGPSFIVRSWGGQLIIFFRTANHTVQATAFNESQYSRDTLKAILKALMSIKPTIELDPQYKAFLAADDNAVDRWKDTPRSMKEIEAYVARTYGPPAPKNR